MDRLIKGVANVVLDQFQDDDLHDDANTRSKNWAQVASGNAGASNPSPLHHQYHSQHVEDRNDGPNEWESSHRIQQADDKNDDGWETVGRKASRHKADDKNDDGWETVGKKASRHKLPKDQWSNYKCSSTEQHYSSDANYGTKIEPSEEELSDLARAANKLWDLDLNRLVPGKDYEIDCGDGKKVYQKDDMAEGCLFSWVNEEVFTRKPTYSRFCALLDNYNPHEGYREKVTAEEISEQKAFIEEISRTAPIKYLHKYLAAKHIASGSYQDFKEMMSRLWFELYSRGGTAGSSSAFEHVFVGEIKRGEQEVSGFHNWIQFYLEEAKGRVDYQGYIFPRRRGQTPDSETQLLTVQFEWNGVLKSVSSTLVGVSPEFEIALYTLCFYLGGEDNHIELGPYGVNIKCYRHGDRLGSAFPIADC